MKKALIRGLVLFAAAALNAFPQHVVGQWEVFEFTMTARGETANPYVEGLPDGGPPFVTATFTGTGGEARGQRYAIPGFWDGGKI